MFIAGAKRDFARRSFDAHTIAALQGLRNSLACPVPALFARCHSVASLLPGDRNGLRAVPPVRIHSMS